MAWTRLASGRMPVAVTWCPRNSNSGTPNFLLADIDDDAIVHKVLENHFHAFEEHHASSTLENRVY